jgi:predicted secreted protein
VKKLFFAKLNEHCSCIVVFYYGGNGMLKSIIATHLLLVAPIVMNANIEQVHLNVGQEYCIELSSCPSAGYEWCCKLGSYSFGELSENRSVVSIDEQIINLNGEQEILGATILHKFVIRAEQPGRALVNFTCTRSWEDRVLNEKHFEFIVE